MHSKYVFFEESQHGADDFQGYIGDPRSKKGENNGIKLAC